MRCRECAAEVAVTARVLSVRGSDCWAAAGGGGHGGGDTVVAAISDAAGKAVPAGVAGQALPEPYVPGSGDRVPAELRLVLAGYVGLVAVVCSLAPWPAPRLLPFSIFCRPVDLDDDTDCSSSFLALMACVFGLWRGRSRRSRRVSGFRGCFGGPAIHARPR